MAAHKKEIPEAFQRATAVFAAGFPFDFFFLFLHPGSLNSNLKVEPLGLHFN
jgi:hypothetical protein